MWDFLKDGLGFACLLLTVYIVALLMYGLGG